MESEFSRIPKELKELIFDYHDACRDVTKEGLLCPQGFRHRYTPLENMKYREINCQEYCTDKQTLSKWFFEWLPGLSRNLPTSVDIFHETKGKLEYFAKNAPLKGVNPKGRFSEEERYFTIFLNVRLCEHIENTGYTEMWVVSDGEKELLELNDIHSIFDNEISILSQLKTVTEQLMLNKPIPFDQVASHFQEVYFITKRLNDPTLFLTIELIFDVIVSEELSTEISHFIRNNEDRRKRLKVIFNGSNKTTRLIFGQREVADADVDGYLTVSMIAVIE